MIESMLAAHAPADRWKEEPWQPQLVMPVLATSREGFQFALLPLGDTAHGEA